MDELNIESILTEEEFKFLSQIEDKLSSYLKDKINKDKSSEEMLQFNQNSELAHPEQITDAPTEIMFHIKAVVTETDENGSPKETIEVLEKFYHIPIINGKNYKLYIDNFIKHFHSKLETTCQELQNND